MAHADEEETAVWNSLSAVAEATALSTEPAAVALDRRAAAVRAPCAPSSEEEGAGKAPSGCTHQLGVGELPDDAGSSSHGTRRGARGSALARGENVTRVSAGLTTETKSRGDARERVTGPCESASSSHAEWAGK